MTLPSAVIFLNSDISDLTKSTLVSQLRINESMTDTEFDARVVADPNYPAIVELQGLRILVIRQSFHDLTNRDHADLVLFFSHGMVTILKNNYGPPGLTLAIDRLNIYELLRYNKSPHVMILPADPSRHSSALGGIFAIESSDVSGVNDPNPDNESNNQDFINRK